MIFGLSAIELVATLLLAGSVFFNLAAVTGVLRLPDFYTRLHAAGKCDAAGLSLALVALALLAGDALTVVKLAFLGFFAALANATATHALGHAARRCGVAVWTTKEGPRR